MVFMARNVASLLPFVGMVVAMLAQVSNMVVTKLALSQSKNKYIIIVYSDALAALILLPFTFHRSDRTPLDFPLCCQFFLFSLFGCSAQIFGYVGLQYSSPAVGSAMLNLIPAFTFMLAIILRLEKLDWRSKITIAKCSGTIVSIAGAFIVAFYKGPVLFSMSAYVLQPHQLLHSPQLFWLIGAFFLAAEAFMNAAWYILQTFILKKFPAVLTLICYLCFINTVLSAIFALFVVDETSAWILKPDIGLLAILYTAIIGVAFRLSLICWCLSKTGPLYVTMFKPLTIIFAAIMDAFILGDSFSIGSLAGAILIVSGFYAVIWGKAKEENTNGKCVLGSADQVPLLRNRVENT